MADPFDDYELSNVRAYLDGEHDETLIAASVAKRLLATLDEMVAITDGRGEVLTALRVEVVRLRRDREEWPSMPRYRKAWRAWWRDPPDEALCAVTPARLRELADALDPEVAERRLAAEHYQEGSKLRDLAERGLVTPARSRDPEGIEAVRAMVRAAAEKPAEEPSDD